MLRRVTVLEHLEHKERVMLAAKMASWNIRVMMAKALFFATLGIAGLVWAITG